MVAKLSLAQDLDIEETLIEFYTCLGLSEKLAKKKAAVYQEYLFRLKGTDKTAEALIDYVQDEAFWVGLWIAKAKPESVIYDPNVVEEEPEPEPEEPKKKIDDHDPMMYG